MCISVSECECVPLKWSVCVFICNSEEPIENLRVKTLCNRLTSVNWNSIRIVFSDAKLSRDIQIKSRSFCIVLRK